MDEKWLSTKGHNTLHFSGLGQDACSDAFPMTLPSGWFGGETSPVLTKSVDCRAKLSAFNASAKFAVVDLRQSYSLSAGARSSPMRGLAIVSAASGGGAASDGLLVLDEFDSSGAANVSWSLHTQANVSISGLVATLTIGAKSVEVSALAAKCPGARWATYDGATEWTPSAKTWPGFTALVLESSSGACTGMQVAVLPKGAAEAGAANALALWPTEGPMPRS